MVGTIDPVRIEQVSRVQDLDAHRVQWEALAESAPASTIAQTYGYVVAGWQARDAMAERLAVLFAYIADRLVAVWPLQVVRRGRLKAARLVGSGSCEEYGSPLIVGSDLDRARVAQALYGVARGLGDLLEVYNLSMDSPLRPILEANRRPKHLDHMSSPVISLAAMGSWEAWAATKTGHFRGSLRQDMRRLAKRGLVEFHEVDAADGASFTAWLFQQKTLQLDRNKIPNHWVRNPGPLEFFSSQIGKPGTGIIGFGLKVGGRRAAGGICLICGVQPVEYFVTAYDRDFEEGAPGRLLIEAMVRWCIERNRDFDFRLSREPYKLRWIDHDVLYTTFIVAQTTAGMPYVAYRIFKALSVSARIWLKRTVLQALDRVRRRGPAPPASSASRL